MVRSDKVHSGNQSKDVDVFEANATKQSSQILPSNDDENVQIIKEKDRFAQSGKLCAVITGFSRTC